MVSRENLIKGIVEFNKLSNKQAGGSNEQQCTDLIKLFSTFGTGNDLTSTSIPDDLWVMINEDIRGLIFGGFLLFLTRKYAELH